MNNEENYKLYRKHKVDLFNMIEDVIDRAPKPDSLSFYFGTPTKEESKEFDKKMEEYLKKEKPKIKERLKEMGFDINK